MTHDSLISIDPLFSCSRSLRISVVTETYPPDVNGVANTLAIVVQKLIELGHEITLIRPNNQRINSDPSPGLEQKAVRGMKIPFYPELKMGLPARRLLRRIWQKNRPDVVHIATQGPLGWSSLKAAKELQIPAIGDFRTNFHAYSKYYKLGWMTKPILGYLKRFHNAANLNLVPTQGLEKELSDLGFHRLSVVPRGINTEQFSPNHRSRTLREKWGLNEGDVALMCVSRLAPEKNIELVIKAYANAKINNPSTKLILVGDGPARHRLSQMAPDVIFAGYQSGNDLSEHYASADVFVFASQTETFGNVVLEAMASGLATVTFDHASSKECITHGENGMKFDLDDEAGFISEVNALISNPALRKHLGVRAQIKAQTLSWTSVVSLLVDQYKCVISHAPAV